MNDKSSLEKAISNLIIEERERKDIVIGAPHHTPGGIEKMPCKTHEAGDENTGFIARKLADMLHASSVIACNYPIDPNKSLGTDYSIQIVQWKTKYLIEIHGHGARRVSDNLIEVSSGSTKRNDSSMRFAETLKNNLNEYPTLKDYDVMGDITKIHFKAKSSATITTDLWTPFHIELPPSIRKDNNNNLPGFVDDFVNCLKETIDKICL
jgi:hypothetical protein